MEQSASPSSTDTKNWLIVGASRGIGLEFVRQLLHAGKVNVFAGVRDTSTCPQLHELAKRYGPETRKGNPSSPLLYIMKCDVTNDASIKVTAIQIDVVLTDQRAKLDYVVINAGVMKYPNRATEVSFSDFEYHLKTNTVGPIMTAQALLKSRLVVGTIVFMSSDSGSAIDFREMEDGFAAYASSKAALNQALRHMAAELKRKGNETIILAMHPGEVATDMANIDLPWEVQGVITAQESVSAMRSVIESKSATDSGTFWTWKNEQHPW